MAGKYRLQRRIGSDSFGAVYIGNRYEQSQLFLDTHDVQGTNIDTGEDVALKLEHVSINLSLLKREVDVYRLLSDDVDISQIYSYETECEYNVMMLIFWGQV